MNKLFFTGSIFFVLFISLFVNAKIVKATAPDFIVGPAKNEISINGGETKKVSFLIVNRLGIDVDFAISTKKLVSDKNGNLVASDLKPEQEVSLPTHISIKSGDTKTITGTISVNKNIEVGSSAFGIFVEPISEKAGEIVSHTRAQIINIINVAGAVNEAGALTSFKITDKKIVRMDQSIPLSISFTNTGNKNLNPYGVVVVKNIFGREIEATQIDPWYVMPQSERSREILIPTEKFIGRYTATISLNRGYGDLVDVKKVSFYVIPFWIPIVFVIILVGIIFWFTKRGALKGALVAALLLAGVVNVHAQMTSGNYKVQFDSVNFGGGLSNSANYKQESTAGEIATGESNSANYNVHAGYQQMNEVFLSITNAADVTLTPNVGDISGGTANGATTVTVTTDGAAGYSLYVNAAATPALFSGTDSFADYTPAGLAPDLLFSVLNNQSFFGFSPEGSDIVSNYKDNGATCGLGALDTADSCWDGFSTTIKQVANSSGANTPAGTATTLKLRAAAGSSRNQTAGNYSGDITFTAAAL